MPIFPNSDPQYFISKQIQLSPEELEIIQSLSRGIDDLPVPFPSLSDFDSLAVNISLDSNLEGDPNPQPNISSDDLF